VRDAGLLLTWLAGALGGVQVQWNTLRPWTALAVLAVATATSGQQLNVFIVAGTVTDKLAPYVLEAFRDTPLPRRVLSFGACANSGGPYWDSYCVTKGVDQFIPVDVYVPGCPPRPEALLAGLTLVLRGE